MGSAKTISIAHPVPGTTIGDLTLALPEAPLTMPETAAAHKYVPLPPFACNLANAEFAGRPLRYAVQISSARSHR